ncbi:MAG TPA: SPFH domain-containing protein [Thermoanaerobaculia bacterium]|nr:SPFH domain-containing protein [Thermoanaerobaculia bacterium]
MGFFGNQFLEVIEWLDQSSDTLVYRFPVHDQEIKMGAQLTVRENQVALFINEGQLADQFAPGRYELTTKNMPIMTTLRSWKFGFESPFKAEVYFFNTQMFTDLKWGTSNPVMMRDTDFGMIRLRAFGTYAMRIVDAKQLFKTIVGTRGLTTTDEISGQLRSTILSRFSDAVAESKIPALDLAAKYEELGEIAKQKIAAEFAGYGVELAKFFIENISLPDEVEAAIDQRTKLGVLGDKLNQYTQLQAADSMKIAAGNPGGLAGAGVGIGAGMAMGNAMGQSFGNQSQQSSQAPPPPPAAGASARWSVTMDGKTFGPYTDDTLRSMLHSGQIEAGVMAWKPGASGWAPLSSFSEFAMSAIPPPPPPPK